MLVRLAQHHNTRTRHASRHRDLHDVAEQDARAVVIFHEMTSNEAVEKLIPILLPVATESKERIDGN